MLKTGYNCNQQMRLGSYAGGAEVSYFNGGEEYMWMRLQDAQREAETRRMLRQARRSRSGRGEGAGRLRRWLTALAV
jgi:hypothetical protein